MLIHLGVILEIHDEQFCYRSLLYHVFRRRFVNYPLKNIADDDCILFMWVTVTKIKPIYEGNQILEF
jgi:N6-adenosine-specific RNA methylase IME4